MFSLAALPGAHPISVRSNYSISQLITCRSSSVVYLMTESCTKHYGNKLNSNKLMTVSGRLSGMVTDACLSSYQKNPAPSSSFPNASRKKPDSRFQIPDSPIPLIDCDLSVTDGARVLEGSAPISDFLPTIMNFNDNQNSCLIINPQIPHSYDTIPARLAQRG